jgi:hypothetical protein
MVLRASASCQFVVCALVAAVAIIVHLYSSPLSVFSTVSSSIGKFFIPDVFPRNDTVDIHRFGHVYQRGFFCSFQMR